MTQSKDVVAVTTLVDRWVVKYMYLEYLCNHSFLPNYHYISHPSPSPTLNLANRIVVVLHSDLGEQGGGERGRSVRGIQ